VLVTSRNALFIAGTSARAHTADTCDLSPAHFSDGREQSNWWSLIGPGWDFSAGEACPITSVSTVPSFHKCHAPRHRSRGDHAMVDRQLQVPPPPEIGGRLLRASSGPMTSVGIAASVRVPSPKTTARKPYLSVWQTRRGVGRRTGGDSLPDDGNLVRRVAGRPGVDG